MFFCLICCFIYLVISMVWFILDIIENWGELIIEDIVRLIFKFLLFVFSILALTSGLVYKAKADLKIEEYEKKMKVIEPIIETNKIIIDGKEYEGKIIDKKLNNFVQLKTKDETLTIIEPKSITTKN